jgi:hypothetical protein
MCNTGFIHCMTGNTGCDTQSTSVDNCGGCGNKCVATNADSNSCDGTRCSYHCLSGFLDCVKVGADIDGCETPDNTVDNCGGCGNQCDAINSTGAACMNGTCTYTGCASGRSDCNQTAPNTDGCECPTAMCCGNSCQPVHNNGLGQTYLLTCTPLGTPGNESTYSVTMATAARAAWPAGSDGNKTCGNGANASACIQRMQGGQCAVWCYTKTLAGRVLQSTNCSCPTGSSQTWN